MVKAYLRYEPALSFGVVASLDCNIAFDTSGKHLLSPALECLALWNLRQGTCSRLLSPSSSSPSPSLAVTSIASSPNPSSPSVASGHADGSIRIWDCLKGSCETTLNGHKGAVTALRYNKEASMLASGSKDSDIILWDLVGEVGLFRLRGHRDQVTDIVFLDAGQKLVSCSKDKFVRVWDLVTQRCDQIVGGHHSEIWSLDIDSEEKYLVTGSGDQELRFYQVKHSLDTNDVDHDTGHSLDKWDVLKLFGEIKRQVKDRVSTVRFNNDGSLLACQVAGRTVEIYKVLDDAQSMKKAKRRIHRKKEKKSSKGSDDVTMNGDDFIRSAQEATRPTIMVSDVFKLLPVLRASKKICSIAFSPVASTKGALATLALSLNNNLLESYTIQDTAATKTHAIELPGHRSDIRSLALSSDSTLLMSTSHNAVKFWNPGTGSCLRTIDSGYGLCCSFVPGNRYALVGTKSGDLEIIDVGSGSCMEVLKAHTDSVRSIASLPDESGFVTGGADHDVKFWDYELQENPTQGSKRLTVTNVKTLKLDEEVLAVCISPNAKYVAASILQGTVRVFFLDSLKFFLQLYGHKLPVLCMDISSDGDLIVTGSSDKNIRIWGMDFGDCHKSIFAHADSVMAVQFVRNTHYVFSVGKDRLVKYWDADKFELLLTLEGHHAEIWCLAVSYRGDFVVTGSHDRSIRRWDRTDEPFFLEEEKEKRLEEIFESDLDNLNENKYAPKEDLPEEGAVGLAGRKTKETLSASDSIIDALDLAEAELKRIEEHEKNNKSGKTTEFQPNILLHGLSPSEYILQALSAVRASDLDYTLLSLTFSDALKLMSYMKDWVFNPDKIELVCRIAIVLLQTHHSQLTATPAAKPILAALKQILYKQVKERKDVMGFNLSAMEHIKEMLALKSDAPFRDAKAKLMEIRSKQLKRSDGDKTEKRERKSKKQKVLNGTWPDA